MAPVNSIIELRCCHALSALGRYFVPFPSALPQFTVSHIVVMSLRSKWAAGCRIGDVSHHFYSDREETEQLKDKWCGMPPPTARPPRIGLLAVHFEHIRQ